MSTNPQNDCETNVLFLLCSWFYLNLSVDTLVFSCIGAEIQILINPVNLPENELPGTELSRAYDKDVAGRPNAYRLLNKSKDFVIDASKLILSFIYFYFLSFKVRILR
jgi:hypothetical protein